MGPYGVCKSGMYLGQKKVSCLERCPHFRGVLIAIIVKVWDHIGRGVRDITSVYPFLLGSVSMCIVLCVSECTALYINPYFSADSFYRPSGFFLVFFYS